MKTRSKYAVTLLFWVLLSSTLCGRPILKDSTEVYNYWAKRGIIEMVYSYMQDYLATVDTTKDSKESKGAKAFRSNFITDIDDKGITEIEKDFLEIYQFLINNNWKSTGNKIFQPLIEKSNQHSSFDEQFFSVSTTYNGNKNWNAKRKSILKECDFDLKKFKKQSKAEQGGLRNNPGVAENPDNTKPTSMNQIDKFLYFLVGLIAGGLLIIMYSKDRIYSILSTERNVYSESLIKYGEKKYLFKYIGIVAKLKERKDDKKKEICNLKNEINQLKSEIEKANNKYDGSGKELIDTKDDETLEKKTVSNVTEWEVVTEIDSTETIYFTIPESDGSFKIINGKKSKELDCFYKIETDKNNQKGRLFFISGDYDLRALDNIDYYLNPVCEIENISDRSHAKEIIMIKNGTVVFSGDNWNIDAKNKVKIKLK